MNKESVRAIQKSIFTICLDAPIPRVSDGQYWSRVAAQMLHGGGARWNSGNRWFDKTLQVSEKTRGGVGGDTLDGTLLPWNPQGLRPPFLEFKLLMRRVLTSSVHRG